MAGNIEDAYDLAGVPITAEQCMEKAFEMVKDNFVTNVKQGPFGATIVIPNLSLAAVQPDSPAVK